MKIINEKRGSAMLIAIVITTFISLVTVATSKLIISEAQINLRYLDGQVANYAAESAIEWGLAATKQSNEIGGTNNQSSDSVHTDDFTINNSLAGNLRSANLSTYVWASATDLANVVIGLDGQQELTVSGAGSMQWQLTNISQRGDNNCPDPESLYVYLRIAGGASEKILNYISNTQGIWSESASDQSYYLTNSRTDINVKPIITTRFLPSVANIEGSNISLPPQGCGYVTSWKVGLAGGAIEGSSRYIKGVGLYGDVKKEFTVISGN